MPPNSFSGACRVRNVLGHHHPPSTIKYINGKVCSVVVLCAMWKSDWTLEDGVQTGNATCGSSRYGAKNAEAWQ